MIVACVDANIVTSIVTIVDPSVDGGAAYQALATQHQVAADVTSAFPAVQVGWLFTGSTLTPPPNYVPLMRITKLALRQRLTITELTNLQTASLTNVLLQVLKDNLAVATYIDLSLPSTIQAVEVLVAYGLLTSDRANTILTTPPAAGEIYQG
jgi:hypothetical protein